MQKQRSPSCLMSIIATLIGIWSAVVTFALGVYGIATARQELALKSNGVAAEAQVIDSQIGDDNCYEIKYEYQIDGVTYVPLGVIDTEQFWSKCLTPSDEEQAKLSNTVDIIYLPSSPEVSLPDGQAYFDSNWFIVVYILFLGWGIFVPLGLIYGWWQRSKRLKASE